MGGSFQNQPPRPRRIVRPRAISEGGSGEDPCDLYLEALLSSSDRMKVSKIVVGDEYPVKMLDTGAGPIIVMTGDKDSVIGSLVANQISQVIICINRGVNFVATVILKMGGIVKVIITRL